MSILNRTNQGQPSILIALAQTLWNSEQSSISEKELIELVAPLAITNQKQVSGALNIWTKLGLFFKTKGGCIASASGLAIDEYLPQRSIHWLRAAVREVALRPENNDPFWAGRHSDEEGGDGLASDFSRGAAWLLAQHHDVHLVVYKDAESLASRQLGNSQLIIQNDTRWKPLIDWMVFMGLAQKGVSESERPAEAGESPAVLICDPAEAIADYLPLIFSGQRELAQGDFFSRLAAHMPIVDGGKYRSKVEEKMAGRWSPPQAGRLSPSLSRAIIRLEAEGKIKLIEKSDAGHGGSDLRSQPVQLWFGADETKTITHLGLLRSKP